MKMTSLLVATIAAATSLKNVTERDGGRTNSADRRVPRVDINSRVLSDAILSV